jgi:hypothetical protein
MVAIKEKDRREACPSWRVARGWARSGWGDLYVIDRMGDRSLKKL